MNIEVADIVTILGNLLDNALESAAKIEDKSVKLGIVFEKGSLLIRVDNAFDGKVKYGKDGAITTLKPGSKHGYGLENIRKAVDRYNGHMEITHTDSVFSVGILLYVDDSAAEI